MVRLITFHFMFLKQSRSRSRYKSMQNGVKKNLTNCIIVNNRHLRELAKILHILK